MIASPLISVEKQSGVIQEIVKKAKLNKLTANFLGVLVQNRRLAALPGIISVFNKIIAERSGVVEVRLETAVKLTAAQAKEFQKKIDLSYLKDGVYTIKVITNTEEIFKKVVKI